jgi:hypothetical protein
MASAISVPFQIACMQDTCGITESNAPGQPTATVKFTCLSSDHYTLIKDLLGFPVAAGLAIIRTYPFQYPPSPNLIATAIESVQFYGAWTPVPGVGLPWLWRKKCKVTCRFELPLWFTNGIGDPSGLPYTTTTFQGSAEFFTIPNTTYTFPSGWPTGSGIQDRLGKVVVTMKRHMMPYAPVPQCFPILGCVNNAAVALGGFSCPTGSLLFTGFSATPAADPLGNLYYDVEYVFEFRSRIWNQVLSPDPTEGWAIPLDGSGNPIYTPANFSSIP